MVEAGLRLAAGGLEGMLGLIALLELMEQLELIEKLELPAKLEIVEEEATLLMMTQEIGKR